MTMTPKQAAAWAVALRLPAPFTVYQVSAHSGAAFSSTEKWLRAWRKLGLVSAEGGRRKIKYRVIAAPTSGPRREQSMERNLWTAMRLLASFTPRDLAAHASTDTLAVLEDDAERYIRSLLPAGYLRVLQKAAPPHRRATYRLIRDTGPEAPLEKRIVAVWDPNEARWTHVPEAPR